MEEHEKSIVRLETKIDGLCEQLNKLFVKVDNLEERLRIVEQKLGVIGGMEKDIDSLEKKSDSWNLINSVAIGIATLVTLIVKGG